MGEAEGYKQQELSLLDCQQLSELACEQVAERDSSVVRFSGHSWTSLELVALSLSSLLVVAVQSEGQLAAFLMEPL